ncbi:MAG: hypothetical protein NTV97_12665 [Alphaproteobacteria bacterium]|nr:hypothetical protein [Alphaproteobacteria bacterium]
MTKRLIAPLSAARLRPSGVASLCAAIATPAAIQPTHSAPTARLMAMAMLHSCSILLVP